MPLVGEHFKLQFDRTHKKFQGPSLDVIEQRKKKIVLLACRDVMQDLERHLLHPVSLPVQADTRGVAHWSPPGWQIF